MNSKVIQIQVFKIKLLFNAKFFSITVILLEKLMSKNKMKKFKEIQVLVQILLVKIFYIKLFNLIWDIYKVQILKNIYKQELEVES